jgi:O-antigen ligase
MLLFPWLFSLPFSGLNENPNRLGRDAALYYKYSTFFQAVILLALVILSQSRGAILFLLTMALARLGLLKSRAVGIMLILICLLSPILFINNGEFLTGRGLAWAYGLELFLESPWLGSGWVDTTEILWSNGVPSTNFHSVYVELLVRFGFVGAVLFIFLLYRLVKSGDLLSISLPFLLLGIFESYLFSFSLGSIFFFAIMHRLNERNSLYKRLPCA